MLTRDIYATRSTRLSFSPAERRIETYSSMLHAIRQGEDTSNLHFLFFRPYSQAQRKSPVSLPSRVKAATQPLGSQPLPLEVSGSKASAYSVTVVLSLASTRPRSDNECAHLHTTDSGRGSSKVEQGCGIEPVQRACCTSMDKGNE